MLDRAGAFLKSVRQHPFGMPFFLAWAAITIAADVVAIVILNGRASWTFQGGTLEIPREAVIALVAFWKLYFQAGLLFTGMVRRLFWIVISTSLFGILFNIPMKYYQRTDFEALIFLIMAICQGLIFIRVKARFWVGAGLAASLLYICFLWDRLVTALRQDLMENASALIKYIYITKDGAIFFAAWTLHSLLTGAVLAWLMPPYKQADTQCSNAQALS